MPFNDDTSIFLFKLYNWQYFRDNLNRQQKTISNILFSRFYFIFIIFSLEFLVVISVLTIYSLENNNRTLQTHFTTFKKFEFFFSHFYHVLLIHSWVSDRIKLKMIELLKIILLLFLSTWWEEILCFFFAFYLFIYWCWILYTFKTE